MNRRDLFVVVADLDAENAVKTLLTERQQALGVRFQFVAEPPPNGDMLRFSGRDSGCYRKAVDLLRPPQRTHRHALLLFDRHGSGAEKKSRTQIEEEIEDKLWQNGWSDEAARAIVLDPELESWVWADSPHVGEMFGWQSRRTEMRQFLEAEGLWDADSPKPADPKRAMHRALRVNRLVPTARLFAQLAAKVGLTRCQDPAFNKFATVLRAWFGTDRDD